MKKQFYFGMSILVLVVIIIGACQDDNSIFTKSENQNDLIIKSQRWYDSQINFQANARIGADTNKISVLKPLWETSRMESFGKDNILIVQTDSLTIHNSNQGMLRVFIFKEQEGEIVNGRIIEFIGTPEYLKENSDNLPKLYRSKEIPNFTGAVLGYNIKYGYLDGYYFKEGKRIRASVFRTSNTSKLDKSTDPFTDRIAPTLRTQTEEIDCTPYNWYLDLHYTDGSVDRYFVGTICVPHNAPGGGTVTNHITNNLTTPCFKSVMSGMAWVDLNNDVQNILTEFNLSPTLNFTIGESFDAWDSETDGTANGTTLTLNSNALQNASQEYIAATIYHEVLHAFIPNSMLINYEHNSMANNYVNPMRDALMTAFPSLNKDKAEALAWGGLENTLAYSLLSGFKKTEIQTFNTKFKNYNGQYNGYGTACP